MSNKSLIRVGIAALIAAAIIGMSMVSARSVERRVYPGSLIRIVFVCPTEDSVLQVAFSWNESRNYSAANVENAGCTQFEVTYVVTVLDVIAGLNDWEGDRMYAVSLDASRPAYTLTWDVAVLRFSDGTS